MKHPILFVIGLAIIVLALMAIPIAFNISDQQERREASYQGCLRGTLDRSDNAEGWRSAQRAREQSYARDGEPEDRRAARTYKRIAEGLESRTRPTQEGREAFCEQAFPPVTFP